MGYRELFLVLVSVILLSLLTTQINVNVVQGREALQQLEIEHIAASMAQRFIEEAKSKLFDAVLVAPIDPSTMPGSFTPYPLGPGSWESYPNYNDVDDYNGFDNTFYVQGMDFRVQIQVVYVQDTTPNTQSFSKTFFKRMRVTVTSSWLPNPVVYRHVFSYFGVR